MLQDITEIQRYAETLCAHASVKTGKRFRVAYSDTTFPYTTEDGDYVSIVLPHLKMSTDKDHLTLARHYIIHEILHHVEGPDVARVWRDNKIPPDFNDPLNGLCMGAEDYRIEHMGASKFKGDAKSIDEATHIILQMFKDKFIGITEEQRAQFQKDKYAAGMMAAMLVDIEARNSWCPSTVGEAGAIEKVLPKEISDMMGKLRAIDYGSILLNMCTEQDAVDAGKAAFKALYDEDPEDHADKQQQQKPQQQPQQADGQEQQGGKAEEKAQEKTAGGGSKPGKDEGEGSGKEKGEKGAEGEKGEKGEPVNDFELERGKTVDYRDLLLSNHFDRAEVASGSGISIDYSNATWEPNKDFTPANPNDTYVHDYIHPASSRNCQPDTEQITSKLTIMLATVDEYHTGQGFANKVRRLIQIRSQSRYIGGQTKGKLHRKNAYRVGVQTIGNGDWNSKVFKSKFQDEVLDTVIQLVVDSSGSMSGEKYQTAVGAALLLNSTFDKTLHIPVEIITFSEQAKSNHIGIIKKYSSAISTKDMIQHFQKFASTCMSCNNDGDAIAYAAARLRKAKQKRKIMIVLSDGSPASRRGDCLAYTKGIIKEIENEKGLEIYGIGIGDDNVTRLYKEYGVIHTVTQLEETILTVVKRKLLN